MKKIVIATAFLAIVACKENKKSTETEVIPESSSVIVKKETSPKEEAKSEPAPQVSLQKKDLKGLEVNLTQAKVVGSVLSVELFITRPAGEAPSYEIPVSQISYIDDATAKKYSLLKDDAGVPMASPLISTNDKIRIGVLDKDFMINLKFPAPSEGAKTVSINIPSFGSFDGINVRR